MIDDDVKSAVEAVAKAKVAEAMGGDIIGKIIDEVMQHKNDKYGRSDAKTWFEEIVFSSVQEVIRVSIAQHLKTDEMKAKIDAAVIKKSSDMAVTIVDAFANDEWNAKLEIKIDR